MSKEVMKLALSTLEGWANYDDWVWPESALEQAKRNTIEAITALRQALVDADDTSQERVDEKTKREQEPVAHIDHRIHGWPDCFVIRADPPHTSPLYLSPPKREWVGLTDDDVSYFRYQATFCDEFDAAFMAELIEKDLKEKNHG